VGAVPGAMPPVIGWCAVRGEVTPEAITLFVILFLWQVPHFLAIAWIYREDYARAGLKMLPVLDADGRQTGRQMVRYCLVLIPVSVLPAALGEAGWLYGTAAVVLGAGFLTMQLLEYRRELRLMQPGTHAYASIFYTTTAFHGAHVTFGVLLLLFTLARALLGHFDEQSHLGVKVTSLYWHFVDVVWLFIFTMLYLSPRWR